MNLLALFLDGNAVGEVVLRPSIALPLALLCAEDSCQAIFEAGGGAPGTSNTCPRCGSAQSIPIAKGLNRETRPMSMAEEL